MDKINTILALANGMFSKANVLSARLQEILREESYSQVGAVKMASEILRANDLKGKVAQLEPRLNILVWTFDRFGQFWELDVSANDEEFFRENFRMSKNLFNDLVQLLPRLAKKDTNWRMAISLEKRIAISLFTLGSSAELRTIGRLFGIAPSTVCVILQEFCNEVWRKLAPIYLPLDFLSQETVEENVNGINSLRFPQCFGAIDECHIEFRPPKKDAIDFYNYKGWYSVSFSRR